MSRHRPSYVIEESLDREVWSLPGKVRVSGDAIDAARAVAVMGGAMLLLLLSAQEFRLGLMTALAYGGIVVVLFFFERFVDVVWSGAYRLELDQLGVTIRGDRHRWSTVEVSRYGADLILRDGRVETRLTLTLSNREFEGLMQQLRHRVELAQGGRDLEAERHLSGLRAERS